jgi:hypothetical protein
MATTTNYGWNTPDDTALVKDGASALRTLGSSIDTSLNTALGTKKAGLVLLNTTSFSAVASQNIPSVFSATYDSYSIVFTFSGSTNARAAFRVSSGASPITTSTYAYKTIGSGTNATTIVNTNSSSGTFIDMGDITSNAATGFIGGSMTVSNVFAATRTAISGTCMGATTGDIFLYAFGGENLNSTSYDGFALTCSTGTITGSVSVYGYNK